MLVAARSAVALHRLLDVLPVFAGDNRVRRLFTLVPGSDFGVDALAAVEAAGVRTIPWDEACRRSFDLILSASPKGALRSLRGHRVLLPHGAGFGKTLAHEGSADSASGLDPEYLLSADNALVDLHALAHPDQVSRLAAVSPAAAARAVVVGDPTLDRMLASRSLRDRFRAALGTGSRRLVVLASTWGPESLLRRRPELPAELAARLPYDTHQLALVVHPNERSRLGEYDLAEQLAPAVDAGLVLAGAYEGWAAALIAADALVTDHGSTALYYAAVADRPIVRALDGGCELIPGSPMAELLSGVPELPDAAGLGKAVDGYRRGPGARAAAAAFAEQGQALERLRRELYALLRLPPPTTPVHPRPLAVPAPAPRIPAAFDVHVTVRGARVDVERFPAALGPPGHHLAAEAGAAGDRLTAVAGLLYHRARQEPRAAHRTAWTAAGWTSYALDGHPGCRTAAAVLPSEACVVRFRDREGLYAVRVEPDQRDGRITYPDPAVALSAVHAWTSAHRAVPTALTCHVGPHAFPVRTAPATDAEAAAAV